MTEAEEVAATMKYDAVSFADALRYVRTVMNESETVLSNVAAALYARNTEAVEYNHDLALRARNGQVGSGMRFRG